MRLNVLLAPVLDPKWPVAAGDNGELPQRYADRMTLSPFDEAALELALRLRDGAGGRDVSLHVCVVGECTERVARKVAAYRPDRVEVLAASPLLMANRARLADALCDGMWADAEAFDLCLMGREFGDCDDGAVPPMLARRYGVAFLGLIHAADTLEDSIRCQRRRNGRLETFVLDRPVLASVTNDKTNRLRHPLMKNVMQARTAEIGTRLPPASALEGLAVTAEPLRKTASGQTCQFLPGSPTEQAGRLLLLLQEEAAS